MTAVIYLQILINFVIYRWIPYTKAAEKCELNCMPKGERFYFRHKRFASDGTMCDEGHICVAGECLVQNNVRKSAEHFEQFVLLSANRM